MKIVKSLPVLICLQVFLTAKANPLSKVFELLGGLVEEVVADGEKEDKAYGSFVKWCSENTQNLGFEIKSATSEKAKLEAKIDELISDGDVATSKIEELAAAISSSEAELKKASSIREKEVSEFAAGEKELMETIDALDRASSILEKEMAKSGSAALAQVNTRSMTTLIQTIGTVVDAASFSSSDKQRLLALVQAEDGEDDGELAAPAADAYTSQSGGVVDLLEDLKSKAEKELDDLRASESSSRNQFEMLKQSLVTKVAADTKDLSEQKELKASSAEAKAGAEGDLEGTVRDLAAAKKKLEMTQSDCMSAASDHDVSKAARAEEIKVMKEAIKILKESTSGSALQTTSLLQVRASSKAQVRGNEVIFLVKKLAKTHHSTALNQLASRISAVLHYGTGTGESPFSKVKTLIKDLIKKLSKEAEAEATEHAFCEAETKKTKTKLDELNDDLEGVSAQIEQAAAKSTELKAQLKELASELSQLAKTEAEMTKARQDEHSAFLITKKELELGLSGVRKAIGVLRDYYGGASLIQQDDDMPALMQQPVVPTFEKKSGAGGGIISILEVVESDFANGLAKAETEEGDAQTEYEKMMQENAVTKSSKTQDTKLKERAAAYLDKKASELSSDKVSTESELSAVMEFSSKLEARCVAKPDSYEERRSRRKAEIAGLKEALDILSSESVFLQRKRRGVLQGPL